jgi:hypothetical protein
VNFEDNSKDLSDFFNTISIGKKIEKEKKESLVGDSFETLFLSKLEESKKEIKKKKIQEQKTIKAFENWLYSETPTQQEQVIEDVIEESLDEVLEVLEEYKEELEEPKNELIERSLGLLAEPSNVKQQNDPLTPLDQKFATLEDLEKHYKLFLSRIQQQLSTLGGGGETRLRYLDDVVGVATNSAAYDGAFLRWNSSTNTAGFSTSIGGLLINETLDTVTDRGNTTDNQISVSALNIPVGSVISGISSIVANIGNENLNVVLEHGDYANLGIGSYGLTYGITGVPYAVYELKAVPTPILQIDDVIAGAAIPVGSKIIGIGTGAYNNVIIADKNFPVGIPLPVEDAIITFARATVNAGMSILTGNDVDITLNAGPGGNIVNHSDILPYTTNEWSLGSPAKRFKQIWFGTGTIYVQDETLGNDQALGAKDGNFYIQGGAGLEVGEWILRDNTLQIKDSTRDVYIGQLGATADIIFNRSVRIEDSSNRTSFYSDRTGRTQFYPPTIPANDIGGVSIIGSTNGAYQPVINSGGMLHITGNDGAVSRITNDAFGTATFPAYISRAGRGTAASPSASQLGDILSRYSTVGFGSTAFAAGLAPNNIEVYARENFTNTAQGAEYRFYNAPIGSITKTLDLTINTEGLSFAGTGSTSGITFYDNSRLTYFPPQTAGTADKFLKVTNVAGNYVMSWETPPTVTGAVIYKGAYNVVTNIPPITDATGEAGWQYTVVGVGTTNFGNGPLSLQDGDLLIHNGTHYDQIPGPRTQLNSDWNATTGVTAILNKPNVVNQIIGGTGVTLSPSNGIGTVTINATGTQNLNSVLTNGNTSALGINVGVVSATSYYGNGVNLTGIVTSIVAGTGGITVSGSTGRVTINGTAQVNSDWTSTVGVASILNKPTIVNQIIAGSGVTISPSNGIGIVTITGAQNLNSVLGYGNTSSLGMSVGVVTTTKLVCTDGGTFSGVVTATSYSGSGTNLTGIVTSIVAGTGVTISNSTGQVTVNAIPSYFISTSTTQASTLTVDFTGPDVIFWQPSANGNRTVTLTNFTAHRGIRIFITPHRAQDTFTFTGVTASQCSNGSNVFQLGGGAAAQASMMIELFSTSTAVGGVWIFAHSGV